MGSAYSYSPLKHQDSIRLIKLKPSRKGDLVCDLIELRLDNSPPYEALSYTWGGQLRDQFITCEGKSLAVTANCKAALRCLCPSFKSRLLWIDAICIDQSSIEERNNQVRMMFLIYAKARRTLIWLGESDMNSKFAFKFLSTAALIRNIPIDRGREFLMYTLRVRTLGKGPASKLRFVLECLNNKQVGI
jgi:hypothetical protein